MKPLLILTLCLAPWLTLQGRNFTSSDGKKTLTAEFVRYNKRDNQVTLRLSNGRNMVADATHFSDKDQEFFFEQAKAAAMEQAVNVEIDEDSDRFNQDTGRMRIRREKVKFTFEIRNTSQFELRDLQIKHWVLVDYDGKKDPKVYEGSDRISALGARDTKELNGPELTLTLGAASTCDCPKVKEAAARIGRDRVIGERIEVRSADGKLLYADSSSNRVDRILKIED